MKENCVNCKYHDVFWEGCGCNLLNNFEGCKFEPWLKPCPFCGGKAKMIGNNVIVTPYIDENGAYVDADFEIGPTWIECQVCHASSNTFYEDANDPENAIMAWNRRA